MKAWLVPVLLAVVIAAAYQWRGELRQRLADAEPSFTAAELKKEATALTFRGVSESEAAAAALDRLRTSGMVRRHRLQDPEFRADVTEALEFEMQAWRRQWDQEDQRRQRLAGQGLTETAMETNIREALLDRAWIEQQITAEVRVTETELQAAFKAQREQLAIPRAYRVAHLFLSRHTAGKGDRAQEIQALHRRLVAGAGWDALVRTASEDARTSKRGGGLGWVTTHRMPAEFMAAVEQLQPGETSAPVATPLGWHLIRLLERRPARQPTLEEVRTELDAALVQKKRLAALERLIRDLSQPHPRTTL